MKPIEKRLIDCCIDDLQQLIDNQHELIMRSRVIANRHDFHVKSTSAHQEAPSRGHWETRPGHPVGWIPDKPEGHWECPAHGETEYPLKTCGRYLSGEMYCSALLNWIPDNWPHKYKGQK